MKTRAGKLVIAVWIMVLGIVLDTSAQQQEIVAVYNGTTGSVGQGMLLDGRRHGQWEIFTRKVKKNANAFIDQTSNDRVPEKVLSRQFDLDRPYQVIQYKHGLLHGEFVENYPSGALKFKANLVSGKLEGSYEAYHENGGIQVKGTFRQDKPHQEWHRFFANGIQESLEYYYNGLRVGNWKWFHETGQLRESIAFVQDVKQGSYQSFYQNGQVQEKGVFEKNEKIGSWQTYFDNGQLASQESFSFGLPDGAWEYYTIDGKLLAGGTYSLGKKLGTWIEESGVDEELLRIGFYMDDIKTGTWKVVDRQDNLLQEEFYKDGLLIAVSDFKSVDGEAISTGNLSNGTGERVFYNADGKIIVKGFYVNGLPDGIWKYFNPSNSNLEKLIGYLEGKPHGEWLTYDASGKVIKRDYYNKGEYISEAVVENNGSIQSAPLVKQSTTLDSNTAMHKQGTDNHMRNLFYSSRHGAN
jgi:uncharacterized protein